MRLLDKLVGMWLRSEPSGRDREGLGIPGLRRGNVTFSAGFICEQVEITRGIYSREIVLELGFLNSFCVATVTVRSS